MKTQKTFTMIKHDGVQRNLVGEIIKRFEQAGLKLVAIKMFVPDMERATKHYGKDDAWCQKKGDIYVGNMQERGETPTRPAIEYGRDIVRALLKYITCGPVIAMVWEGNQSVAIAKKLAGGTEPTTSDVGTIRGDYTLDSYAIANMDSRAVRNLIHITDPADPEGTAEMEIGIWFSPEEIIAYRHINEAMLYDANLDGILE
jgi:nucleoside-diphosphate kinase